MQPGCLRMLTCSFLHIWNSIFFSLFFSLPCFNLEYMKYAIPSKGCEKVASDLWLGCGFRQVLQLLQLQLASH